MACAKLNAAAVTNRDLTQPELRRFGNHINPPTTVTC